MPKTPPDLGKLPWQSRTDPVSEVGRALRQARSSILRNVRSTYSAVTCCITTTTAIPTLVVAMVITK